MPQYRDNVCALGPKRADRQAQGLYHTNRSNRSAQMPQDKVLMGRGILVQYWHTDTLGTVTILTGQHVCSQWQQKAILRHKTNLSTSQSKQQQKNGLKIQVKLQNYTRLCHAHYDYNLIIFYDIKETVRDKRCKLSSVRGGGGIQGTADARILNKNTVGGTQWTDLKMDPDLKQRLSIPSTDAA